MSSANIYQIFFDDRSRKNLDPSFIPLDNTANKRPDWFEFWVIRNFLSDNNLDEDSFYGFLSPAFRSKTGVAGADLLGFVRGLPQEVDVVLMSHAWDQIAYFKNAFEQGEYYHPGLLGATEQFISRLGIDLDVRRFSGHSMNTVFSNYFLAKPKFWRQWLVLADSLWDMCEHQTGDLTTKLNSTGNYRSGQQDAALKVFLGERIVCMLLANPGHVVINLDLSFGLPVNEKLFMQDMRTRKLLNACDTLKLEYDFGKDAFFDEAWQQCRTRIAFNDYLNEAKSLWLKPLLV